MIKYIYSGRWKQLLKSQDSWQMGKTLKRTIYEIGKIKYMLILHCIAIETIPQQGSFFQEKIS